MILDRYIGKSILGISLLALFSLVAIFSFFTLVDQLDDTGRGSYGVMEAIQYVLLTVPRLCYELFPIATVIGSMAALGLLANTSELAVIRTSGVSQMRMAFSLMKTGLIFVVISVLIGEVVAPISEQAAQRKRSIALTEQISLKTKNGFWSRDGDNYINIRKILPNDRVEEIYIYEFDEDHKLRSSIRASSAEYDQDKWILHDILKTEISDQRITTKRYKTAEWEALLNPEVINLVTIKPRYLSIKGLMNYIEYLKANNQSSNLYVQAFWSKIVNPFAIMAMMLLAICVVKCEGRPVGIGQRVFIGAILGVSFHLINQVSGHLGIVYGVPAFLSATLPTILVLSYIFYTINKKY
ncbi:MAG TPA: LPS export ABC transporter permease LptG [Thiotrichaceae bacterium]|jgi:lipopolysaccharide export system permease protein|nr:LPS export ABC transporter permease LptG [Thiotrichaceae bacterium]HIM08097.1 LPS export ABC transporter permease LptG [Gammaproteobacteria bacterium]